MESILFKQFGNNAIIKRSEESLLISSIEDKDVYIVDPKTLGVLETLKVKTNTNKLLSFKHINHPIKRRKTLFFPGLLFMLRNSVFFIVFNIFLVIFFVFFCFFRQNHSFPNKKDYVYLLELQQGLTSRFVYFLPGF